ncbi:MAG: hypothetical protein GY869_12715, partial [Planctomycetes bacterium]|nr:hypothetical protein [Planctomycetota bacterium]
DDGFTSDASFCLFDAGDGKILTGGRKGFIEYDGVSSTIVNQDMDRVSSFESGLDGDIWVATLTGLHGFHNGVWMSNTEEDGLANTAVYKVFIDSKNRVWAGTAEGISLYHPASDRDPPETTIDPEKNVAEVGPSGDNQFSFYGIDKWKYTDTNRLMYSYRINDRNWSTFRSDTVATVDGLDSGLYTFEVRAVDRNWNIDPTPARFEFQVMAPWFYQPMFLLAVIIGGIITLISIYYAFKHHKQLHLAKIKAELATQAKSQFLAKMSHEIRTPLNGIIGNLELITFSNIDTKQNALLNSVHVSAQTLLKIVGDVLDFAKIETDTIVLEYVEMAPNRLIEDIFFMMSNHARDKNIVMLADIDPFLPQAVICDPVRIRQVLMNLIGNSIKFTNNGGVYISAHCLSIEHNVAVLHFEVFDTGKGFSADPDDVFKEFVQFDTHYEFVHRGKPIEKVEPFT